MVKASSCGNTNLRKWSAEEDQKLINYIKRYGIWNWTEMPKPAGLLRSGKSCRLRWMNYLRPDIKRGNFSQEEDQIIIKLHEELGNPWSKIAERLPGRTDNEIKNRWHTCLNKYSRNNQVASTSAKRRQKATVEANQKNPSNVDLLLDKSPKASNLDGHKVPPSPSHDCEIYKSEMTEAKDFSNKEVQNLCGLIFPMEGLYSEDDYGTISVYPEFMALTSQWELLEDMDVYYDGGFDLWA